MKTFNFKFNNISVKTTLDIDYFNNYQNIFIQIFSGASKAILQKINNEIKLYIPHAIAIGSSTDGEINNYDISTKKTIISISIFKYTTIKNAYINTNNSFLNGKLLARKLIEKNTKLLIVFTDGTNTNGEEFLRGIENVNNKVIVAGGMAGDNNKFIQTYISCGNLLLEHGTVGVSLNSDILNIYNDYSFNWSPIGIGHIINKVKDNRVYLIDKITPVEFYSKYLGKNVADLLPATGIEFPLIIEKDKIQIARAVISKHDDGSLSFAGNLNEGDIVRLGFGNAEMIMNNPLTALEKFNNIHIETFYIYSCMARRRYMQDIIQIEIAPFAKIAPVSGFFTYGEFYHNNGKNELLNQTLTVVALSESNKKNKSPIINKSSLFLKKDNDCAITIQALTHLIQQSTADLEDKAKKINKEKNFSQELLAKQKLFMKYAIHEIVAPLSVIMNNIELYEMEYEKNLYLSNIEASMKNIFTTYDDLSYLVKKDQINYPKHKIDIVEYITKRIDFFKQVAIQTSLSINFQTNCNKIIINFNETKLQRIIDNNIANALKYTLENEIIYIKINSNMDSCVVSITSKSTHIQQPKKVFKAYYREGNIGDGFGLGLNLVKQICDEEGISISLASTLKNTCFEYLFKISK